MGLGEIWVPVMGALFQRENIFSCFPTGGATIDSSRREGAAKGKHGQADFSKSSEL